MTTTPSDSRHYPFFPHSDVLPFHVCKALDDAIGFRVDASRPLPQVWIARWNSKRWDNGEGSIHFLLFLRDLDRVGTDNEFAVLEIIMSAPSAAVRLDSSNRWRKICKESARKEWNMMKGFAEGAASTMDSNFSIVYDNGVLANV